MTLIVNGQSRDFDDTLNVRDLLARLEVKAKHVAVEVNLEIVPRSLYETRALHDGDQIEIVTLVGGG